MENVFISQKLSITIEIESFILLFINKAIVSTYARFCDRGEKKKDKSYLPLQKQWTSKSNS